MSSSVLIMKGEHIRKIGDWALLKRLFTYLGRHKRLFMGALSLYPLNALAVVLPPFCILKILDEVIPQKDIGMLKFWGGLYLMALIVEYFSGFFSQFAMSVLGQRGMRDLRSDLFRHVLHLPSSYHDRNTSGRTLTRLTNDVENLGDVFATGAVTVVGDIITLCSVVAMMLWLDVRLTLFSFLVVPPLILLAWIFQRFARQAFREIRVYLSRINAFLVEHITGMNVVQVFGQEKRSAAEFTGLNNDYRQVTRKAILFDALLYALVEAIGIMAIAALIWYGAADLSQGIVGAGTFVAFMAYIRRFFVPVRDLSQKFAILQSAFSAAERCFELLDEAITIDSKPDAESLEHFSEQIKVKNISFAYREVEGQPDWILKDLNLELKPGEKIALVGTTGSGKTTLLKLLNRFYDVQEGAIELDGRDIKDVDLQSLRKLFAVVLQDVYLFSGTVRENLRFGDNIAHSSIERAAKAVQVDDLIARLPQGYDTPVQHLGTNFSAGERQLLAFARALSIDPEILLLDEATSSIDSETESRIQKALEVLLKGRSAIIVAHRLSTIKMVDRIFVLQAGQVVESGTHQELLEVNGVYRRLAKLQLGE
jgi:ATP-binding cassette subfamily B multidrug efflux pump